MLVITRRLKEKLLIGDKGEIVITIVECRPGRVTLGIDAPKDVKVYREEVYEEMTGQEPPK